MKKKGKWGRREDTCTERDKHDQRTLVIKRRDRRRKGDTERDEVGMKISGIGEKGGRREGGYGEG